MQYVAVRVASRQEPERMSRAALTSTLHVIGPSNPFTRRANSLYGRRPAGPLLSGSVTRIRPVRVVKVGSKTLLTSR